MNKITIDIEIRKDMRNWYLICIEDVKNES